MRKTCFFSIVGAWLTLLSTVALGESPTTPKSDAGTGLEGIISISPVQAGPIRQGVPDSKPLADTEFVVAKENKTVTSFQTDAKGRFHISLPPGHYTVSRKGLKVGIGFYGPFEVEIAPGEMKKVQWACDSGIR